MAQSWPWGSRIAVKKPPKKTQISLQLEMIYKKLGTNELNGIAPLLCENSVFLGKVTVISIWFWKGNFKSLVVKSVSDEDPLFISFQHTKPAVERHGGVPQLFVFFWQLWFFWNVYDSFFIWFLVSQLPSWLKFCSSFLHGNFCSQVSLTFTCSRSTIETLERSVNYVQS